ncbi:MAG: translation initiation factor IF-2 subunit beta [Nanoarchaeota archaeon]
MANYEEMLKQAYSKVKLIESNGERFEIPIVQGMIEGNKTIVTNFKQICDHLRRDCNHLLKFLQRELASPGTLEGDRLILIKRVPSSKINEKINQYVQEFVICKECMKPDSELLKQGEFMFLHCLACGAKHSVRAKIQ